MDGLNIALIAHFVTSALISLSVAFYFTTKGIALLRRPR